MKKFVFAMATVALLAIIAGVMAKNMAAFFSVLGFFIVEVILYGVFCSIKGDDEKKKKQPKGAFEITALAFIISLMWMTIGILGGAVALVTKNYGLDLQPYENLAGRILLSPVLVMALLVILVALYQLQKRIGQANVFGAVILPARVLIWTLMWGAVGGFLYICNRLDFIEIAGEVSIYWVFTAPALLVASYIILIALYKAKNWYEDKTLREP